MGPRSGSRRDPARSRGRAVARPLLNKAPMRATIVLLALLAACGGSGTSDPPPTPLRRLSHVEYRNTVRDLFPGVVLPEVTLAPDTEVYGFENNADALAASPLLVEQYLRAA